MKKMIITALAVMVCMVASAAQISWGSGTSKVVNSDGTAADYAALATLGSFVLVDLSDNSVVGPIGLVTTGGPGAGRVNGTYLWDYATAAQSNGDTFLVMFQLASDSSLTFLIDQDTDVAVTTSFTIAGMGDNSYTATYNFGIGGNFYVVPEPTSMALLTLGIVALGLRRRK